MLSDNELAQRVLTEPEVFGELVGRYESKISRYIGRYIGYDNDQIEDVLQEVFILAYRNIASYNPNLSWSSWMYRVARNYAISFTRKQKNASISFSQKNDINIFENISDDIDIAEDQAICDINARIMNGISLLPDALRDTVLLYYFEQKDYSEISDILRKPPGTIATHLNKAKKQLKRILIAHNIST